VELYIYFPNSLHGVVLIYKYRDTVTFTFDNRHLIYSPPIYDSIMLQCRFLCFIKNQLGTVDAQSFNIF